MSDIAAMLHVSKPSVNKAMGVLKDAGYIHQEVYGTIHLTEAGRQYAEKVYSRHVLFKRFLTEVLENRRGDGRGRRLSHGTLRQR